MPTLKAEKLNIARYNLISNKYAFLVMYTLISVFTVSFCFTAVLYRSVGLANLGWYSLSAVFVCMLFLLFIFGFSYFRTSPENTFFLVAVPASIAFALFMLPGFVPDEAPHIWQAVDLFGRHSGSIVIPNVLSTDSLSGGYAHYFELLSSPDTWEHTFISYRSLGTYFDHLYCIQALVIAVFRLFNLNALLAIFCARCLLGIIYVIMGYWMIKIIPYGKTALTVFLLNPMLIQQQASCSADAVTNIVALWFVVLIFYYENRMSCIGRKEAALLATLSVLLLFSKLMFFPLIIMSLVLVKNFVNSKTEHIILSIFTISAALVSLFIIVFYKGDFLPEAFELLRSPVTFIKVFLKSVWEMGPVWVESFAGYNLGKFTINVWKPCFWAYIILQFIVLFYNDEDSRNALRGLDRIIICIVALADFIMILLSMRGWTLSADNRSDIIMGVQGRYLYPLVLPVLICILRPIRSVSKGNVLTYSISIMTIILIVDVIQIVQFF